jgi:hypothetical protein
MIRRETRNSGKLGNGEKPVLLNEVEPGQRARRQRAKPRHGAPLAGTSVPRPRPFPSPPSRLTSTVFGLSLGNCKAYIPRRAGGGRIVGRMRGHTRAPVFLPATAKGGGPDPPAWCRRFTKAQSLLSPILSLPQWQSYHPGLLCLRLFWQITNASAAFPASLCAGSRTICSISAVTV